MFAKENKLAVGPYVVVNTEFHYYYYYYYYYTRLTSLFPIPNIICCTDVKRFCFERFENVINTARSYLKFSEKQIPKHYILL